MSRNTDMNDSNIPFFSLNTNYVQTTLPRQYNVEQVRHYIFGDANDAECIELEYKLNRIYFRKKFETILEQWGLGAKLQMVIEQSNPPLQIADFGCAEGLFLHEMSQQLEENNLLKGAILNGIDFNQAAIATAEDYKMLTTPPRPYLNFYLHDLTRPFEDHIGLRFDRKLSFDFIFVRETLQFIPDAKTQLTRFWNLLKPGGIIYISSGCILKGEEGWLPMHPMFETTFEICNQLVRAVNGGIDVTSEVGGWLEDLGAGRIETERDIRKLGGKSKEGLQLLRWMLASFRNLSPLLIEKGLMTKKQYEQTLADIYREFGPAMQGQFTYIDTVALKPYQNALC